VDGQFMSPDGFPKASYCGTCHEEAYRQWRQSAHANAFRAPFYRRSVDILIDTKGIEYSRHCEGCHNPIALFSGALSKGVKMNRWFDDEGITCMTCHSVSAIQNTSGTGSYVMGTPVVMLNPDGTPHKGLPTFDEILANPELHKKAVMKDFYSTPEFCATCHKAAVPRILNDYKWLRAFSVYDEWQNSSWSKQSPLPFYSKDTVSTCQTCHMPAAKIETSDYAGKDGMLRSHRWVAANTAIPYFYGFDEQLKKTVAFLQDDKLAIDIFGVTKNGSDKLYAPIDKSDFTVAPGDVLTFSIYVTNKGIGHSLVPEQRDFYESWMHFTVTDADGKTIADSGFIKPDGYLDERAHTYTNRLIDKDGKYLDLHQVWLTHTKAYDNTINPGSSELVRYQITVPHDAKGPLKITAAVDYRRFRQGWIEYALQRKGVRYPVAQMASKSLDLNIGENKGNPAPPDKNEMLRWNNYGISLINQQQYAKAVEAFERVVQIDPQYVSGYINIAVADYSYEKYEPAMKMLDKALAMSPGNARALYYKAAILKIQGKLDDSIALLKQVVAQYPRFRNAYRDLGFTYYQQKKYDLARQNYEALQGIDPDDLSAHYNLMLIYRRLGMKDKAARQAAYFADEKDDPGASAFALEYLRANPQVSSESVPWHVHVETPPRATVGGGGIQ
jgi:tetratricopeptide (TPR) repeat protein